MAISRRFNKFSSELLMETLVLWFEFFLNKVYRESPGGLWLFSQSHNHNKCTFANISSQPLITTILLSSSTRTFNETYLQMTLQIFMNIGNILNVILLQMSINYDKNVSYIRLELWLGMYVMMIIC